MQEIDVLLERINVDEVTPDLKRDIAQLIRNKIEEHRDSLGTWEKVYFAHSISALATNLNARFQPTDTWLRLCLVSLEKALIPIDERSPEANDPDPNVDIITYEMLVEAIESMI
jgi:hypothetical protein